MEPVGEGFVFDSNILIYHINGQLSSAAALQLYDYFEKPACISTISVMEILSWPGHSAESFAKTSAFLEIFEEVGINADIKMAAIKTRQNHRLKLPDAIIAATALHLRLTLVTRNIKDFKQVNGLTLLNPFEDAE